MVSHDHHVVVLTAVAVILAALSAAAFAWWRLVSGIRSGRWRSATGTELAPLGSRWSRLATDPWLAEPLSAAIAVAAAVAAALLLVVAATTPAGGGGRDDRRAETTETTMPVVTAEAVGPSSTLAPRSPSAPDGECIGLCAHITDVSVQADGELLIEWEARNFTPNVTNFHVHFFYDIYEPEQVGTNAAQFGTSQGNWHLTDEMSFDTTGTNVAVASAPAGATRICVVVADSGHGVANPENADCVDLP
ncbi:MAG: hypothetical protein AAGE88_10425 [Actinomycetota bacterium]